MSAYRLTASAWAARGCQIGHVRTSPRIAYGDIVYGVEGELERAGSIGCGIRPRVISCTSRWTTTALPEASKRARE